MGDCISRDLRADALALGGCILRDIPTDARAHGDCTPKSAALRSEFEKYRVERGLRKDDDDDCLSRVASFSSLPTLADDDSTSCASGDTDLFEDAIEAEDDIAASADSRPDLSGKWLFVRHEGDFDDLMLDAGVGWPLRKTAQAVGYGAGIIRCDIAQNGDRVELGFPHGSALGGHTMRLDVGSGEQAALAEDGQRVVATPRWEGLALVIEARLERSGASIQPVRRFLRGDELVAESTTSKGAKVRRFFRRV